MKNITEKQAIEILKKYSTSKKAFNNVLKHSLKVKQKAFLIAKNMQAIDLDFVKIGSILHDIGRFNYPPGNIGIKHGIEGARILRKEGYIRYAKLCERHLGVGITKKDIIRQKLDLPLKDYVPRTIEEKIVAYADNFVSGDKFVSFKKVLERFQKELGNDYAVRLYKLRFEIEKYKKI